MKTRPMFLSALLSLASSGGSIGNTVQVTQIGLAGAGRMKQAWRVGMLPRPGATPKTSSGRFLFLAEAILLPCYGAIRSSSPPPFRSVLSRKGRGHQAAARC